jgi:hypothetical protein
MAESKSSDFPLSIRAHSEKAARNDIIGLNSLAAISEYGRGFTGPENIGSGPALGNRATTVFDGLIPKTVARF